MDLGIKNYKALAKSNRGLFCLSLLLTLPTVLDFLSVVVGSYSMTALCYAIVLVVMLPEIARNILNRNSNAAMAFILAIVAINYLIFPASRQYMTDLGFTLCLLLYVPVGVYVVKNITDWMGFFNLYYPFCVIAILMNLYLNFFSGVDLYNADVAFNYMELSYAVLPAVCGSYAFFRQSKKWIPLLVFVLGLVSVLYYGARAVLFFVLFFAISYELLSSKMSHVEKGFVAAVVAIAYLNVDAIIKALASIGFLSDSRFINKYLDDALFGHYTRTIIFEACENRLNSMGLEVSGLFGDRPFCGDVYPHNIVYEILMSFGWIFGTIALVLLLMLFIKSFRKEDARIICLFLFFAILCRFFVSGSYIIEGRFWLMLFSLLSLVKIEKPIFSINE